MGKTNPTYRSVLDRMQNDEWRDFRRTLRKRDQPLFDDLWKMARDHADAANAANPRPIEGALFSMMLAQQREIVDLQEEIEQLREEIGVNAGRIESLEHDPSVEMLEAELDRAEDFERRARK